MKINKKILGIFSIFIMYALVLAVIKISSRINFSIDLMFFATLGITYVALHFFFNIKKLYENMFRFRYLIVIGIFSILVIGGYNGSSMGMWNSYIDTNISIKSSEPILGVSRAIRSDEWLVTTPAVLSQLSDNVKLGGTNNLINAKSTDVTFYPRFANKSYSIILNLSNIGYLFLPKAQGYSFAWYFSFFALFLVSIELFMIITKGNKLYSVLGAFLITLAPSVVWWNQCWCQLYGEAALLIINYFIKSKVLWFKLLMSILLGWIATCYILITYPAWQVPYGFFFVLIFVWMIIENIKLVKFKDLLYLIITAFVCGILFFPLYFGASDVIEIVSNTVYPGARASYGGGNWHLAFDYIANIFLPYIGSISNPCELSQYISFYPLPLIMGIVSLYKNKKNGKKLDVFLSLMVIFSIILSIWCIFPLPKILSKLTFMTMSTAIRAQLILGYTSIFMLIYLISNYEKKDKKIFIFKNNIKKILFSILCFLSVLYLSNHVVSELYKDSLNLYTSFISTILFLPLFYFIVINNKKTNFLLVIGCIVIVLISSITVNPISKGLSVFYEKPFAKEIQKLVKEDKNSVFLAVNSGLVLPNYILANGGKTINSTNFVPNLDLWKKLDTNSKYNSVYNRYSHVAVNLTTEQTSFELLQDDAVMLYLSYSDICKTKTNYLVSTIELDVNDNYYSKIYDVNNMHIYETNCEGSAQ